MVPISYQWLPILLSAVFVFLASWIIHMLLPYHRSDFGKVPDEDAALDAVRKLGIPPGDYMFPCAGGPEGMKNPEFKERLAKGPVVMMTVMKGGSMNMGSSLLMWFIYLLVVGVFVAYVTGRALGSGAPYLSVFRFAGVTAFTCYSVALWQNSIWYKHKWSTTIKHTFDGLIYALLTAGTFGWLWPQMIGG